MPSGSGTFLKLNGLQPARTSSCNLVQLDVLSKGSYSIHSRRRCSADLVASGQEAYEDTIPAKGPSSRLYR